MIRVMVADDENRICKLIVKLIDWDSIGMLIIGVANNGVEALELVEKGRPDIIITDIRMPGYDGLEMIEKAKAVNQDLEFIIISGYSDFEYAQKAIGYGVKDYLLKPINQQELLNALLKVKGHIIARKGYIHLENQYKSTLKNDRYIIRKSFLDNLMVADGSSLAKFDLEDINEKYYFNFKPYLYRVVALKFDETLKEPARNLRDIIESTIESICLSLLCDICDAEGIIKKSYSYILMNYKEEDNQLLRGKLFKVLADFQVKISKTEKISLTIGYGKEVKRIEDIKLSFDSAKAAIEDRIIKGTGRLINYNEIKTDRSALEGIFSDFSNQFVKAVGRLDKEGIKKSLLTFKKDIGGIHIEGSDLKASIFNITDIFDLALKANYPKGNYGLASRKDLEDAIEGCLSPECLFKTLLGYVNTSLSLLEKDWANRSLGQINEAKEYIEANYMNNLNLEDVGAHIGFNPSYFSSLFKKETGTSFVEYLSMIRMEKAKDLLREPDLRIQDVCLMVGYSDVKYFSKLFTKHTGLKPKDYRKIFL